MVLIIRTSLAVEYGCDYLKWCIVVVDGITGTKLKGLIKIKVQIDQMCGHVGGNQLQYLLKVIN